jgi:transcriptional regulator with XRE-family HTH domain
MVSATTGLDGISSIFYNFSTMIDGAPDLNLRIAARVRGLRTAQGLSLETLAGKSGVSRSMISLIERGETSATAVVLDKVAAGLGVTLASLFEPPAKPVPAGPVARRKDQPEWQDLASGYVRRIVSPPGPSQSMRIVEIHFPPRAHVAFENGPHEEGMPKQIWVLEGEMEVTMGEECYRLRQGDCLAMPGGQPTMYHNPTRHMARYVVVSLSEPVVKQGL